MAEQPDDSRLGEYPADSISFEGGIPADAYGGGSVIVGDSGTWRNASGSGGDAGDHG